MAYIDDAEITTEDILQIKDKTGFLTLAKLVLWQEFEKHKHESKKGHIFGIGWLPYSIKLAKAQPFMELFLGKNPYAV